MESNFEFCLIGNCTDVGRVRKANEDSMDVFDTAQGRVCVVCDGMGGHVGGQVASRTAISAIREFMSSHVFTDPREAISNAIIYANNAIIQKTKEQPELTGMGSTCVMLVVTSEGRVYYGHVGDSRIYIIANHKITQLTKDHSYVQTLVDSGQIKKEDAEHHPRKNEITNVLGLPDMLPPTVCNEAIEPEAGNCFLLCSDGLSGMVDDKQIEHLVSKHEIHIQARAEKLVQMANEAGGKDNITVELVEFAVSTVKSSKKKISGGKTDKKMIKRIIVAVCTTVLVLGILGSAFILYQKGFRIKNINTNTEVIETPESEEPKIEESKVEESQTDIEDTKTDTEGNSEP